MIKHVLYLIAILVFLSCSQNVIDDLSEKEQDSVSTNFSFVDIEYIINEGISYTAEIIKRQYPVTINNNSNTTQIYVFDPQKNIFEVSTFSSSDTRAFSFVDDQQKVKVPITMSDDGTLTYDKGERWTYSGTTQKLRPLINERREIAIKPNHKLLLTASFKLRDVVTDYRLYLKGVEFGEELVIEGVWGGGFFIDYELNYTMELIE